MKNLIGFFLKRSFLVNLISVFVVISGLFHLLMLKRDLIPPFALKHVQVWTSFEGASPLEVEKYLSSPIESALSSLTDVKEIKSSSRHGVSEIKIRFEDSVKDVSEKVDEVRNLVQSVRSDLPDGIEEPNIFQDRANSAFFRAIALKNFDESNEEHRRYVQDVKEQLINVKGIHKVDAAMKKRSYNVSFDLKQLQRYELTLGELVSRIKKEAKPHPVSSIDKEGELVGVHLSSKLQNIEDIAQLLIRSPEFGSPLYLKDIASLEYDYASDKSFSLLNNQPFLMLRIRKDVGSDIIKLSQNTDALFKELKKKAPQGVEYVEIGSGTDFVKKQLDVLKNNAAIGLILVLLILSYFLNPRIALMTALGLPLSYLATFVVLYYLGMTVNLISLIAMILIIGILVDDAIVVAERYTQFLQEGRSKFEAAQKAALSVVGPVTAGIITTMIAFMPIIFMGGWMSEIMISIPVVIIAALLMSWLEAFFLLPEHLKSFVKGVPQERPIMNRLKSLYSKILKGVLTFRYLFALGLVLLFVATGYVFKTKIKSDFTLSIHSKRIVVLGALNKEFPKEVILEKLQPITSYLTSLSEDSGEVKNVFLRVGRVWMDGARKKGNRYFRYSVNLKEDLPAPDSVEKKYFRLIKKQLKEFKTADFKRLSVESQLNADEEEDFSKMYTLNFSGRGDYPFSMLLRESEALGKELPGFVSLSYDLDSVGKAWEFDEDSLKLKEYGITKESLALQLRALTSKTDFFDFHKAGNVEKITWSYDIPKNLNFESLSSLSVQNKEGLMVPLSRLGVWKENEIQKNWTHINRKRNLSLRMKFDDNVIRDEDFKTNLVKALPLLQKKFPDFKISTEISDFKVKESKEWMLKTIALCILGIFFILALQLQSLLQPLVVCSSIFFGFVGAVWAIYFHGHPMKIMGMMGLLGVAGVAVNDSVIMVDYINKKLAKSFSKENLIQGATDRLRAILLTTITTLGGLFPMAYAWGGDSGFTRPMALSMAWGLTASTLLTIFAVPTFLMILNDLKLLGLKLLKRS